MSTVKLTTTVDTEIHPYWIEFILNDSDLFRTSYVGYWLAGMEHDDDKNEWLVYETGGDIGFSDVEEFPEYAWVVQDWKDGKPLPEKWFRLDQAFVIKSWGEGFKRGGAQWYEKGDAVQYDVAIQMALLGEIRYG